MIEQSGDFYALSCDVCGETYMTFGETFDEAEIIPKTVEQHFKSKYHNLFPEER